MPPASLHHEMNASAASRNSRFWVNPKSVAVPSWMVPSLTPVAVLPLALPGWHTFLSDPKSAAVAVVVSPPPADERPSSDPREDSGPVRAQPTERPSPPASTTATVRIRRDGLIGHLPIGQRCSGDRTRHAPTRSGAL